MWVITSSQAIRRDTPAAVKRLRIEGYTSPVNWRMLPNGV